MASAACAMRCGELGVELAEVGVDACGGALDAAEPADDATGTRSPETGKFSTALAVSPPHSSCSVTLISQASASVISFGDVTLPA